MMHHLTRTLRASIVNPNIVHTKRQLATDNRIAFYPVVGYVETKLGALSLNKPDNNNNITEQCCDELFRFINTYHHDHTVQNVFIQNKGKIFSGGADYDELLCNQLYLDKLYRMAIMLATFNKPIFAKVNGPVRGIAAYLVNMMSTPMGTEISSMRLDETARGFIPIIGGSHQLANLPCNLGLFLALTGRKLNRDEMTRMGYLKAQMQPGLDSKQFRKKLSDANLYMRIPLPPEINHISEDRKDSVIRTKYNSFRNMVAETQKEIFSSKRNFYNKFALNQYRLAKAEFENIKNPFTSFNQDYNRSINNYFQIRHDRPFDFLKKSLMIEESYTTQKLLSGVPLEKIINIFSKNTLNEVMQALGQDKSAWARETEKQIRKKDPLAALLTFQLINRAKDLTWTQALQLEYTVARRLLKDSEISIQVNEYSSRKIFKNHQSLKKIQEINWAQAKQKYFDAPRNSDQILEHEVLNHSLLPTSKYFRTFPDSVRNYVNQIFFEDRHAQNQKKEIRRFLQINKIDYRDKSYNLDVLRETLYKETMYTDKIGQEEDRIRALLTKNSEMYETYREKRMKFIDEKFKNKAEIIGLIGKKLQKYFNSSFEKRFDDLQNKTASLAGQQTKMDIFRNYQRILLDNCVLNGFQYEDNLNKSLPTHIGIVNFDGHAKDGGSLFTASETEKLKNNEFWQDLKQQYKKNGSEMSEEFVDRHKHEEKDSNMVYDPLVYPQDKEEQEKEAVLNKKYGKSIIIRGEVYKYKKLIQNASETSEEVASLLGWEESDIQSVITNAPKPQETHLDFTKGLAKNVQTLQKNLDYLNQRYDLLMNKASDEMIKATSKSDSSPFESGSSKLYFFDVQQIPKPFRKVCMGIFQYILEYFIGKYEKQGNILPALKSKGSGQNFLDEWVEKSVSRELTEFLKNDVEYVFSYITILYMKDVLAQVKDHQQLEPFEAFVSDSGFQFEDYEPEEIETLIQNFFHSILDLYADSKQRILFPETKLLDFVNRLKTNTEMQKDLSFSFETFMLLIAKDRKRIRDRRDGKKPLLGYEPEYSLSLFRQESKKYVHQKRHNLYQGTDPQQTESNPAKESFESVQQIEARIPTSEKDFQKKMTPRIRTVYQYHKNSCQFKTGENNGGEEGEGEEQGGQNSDMFEIPEPLRTKDMQLADRIYDEFYERAFNHMGRLSMNTYQDKNRRKRLILGFQYYVMKLQSVLHKAAGRDHFLPDWCRENLNKQAYETTKKLLRTDLPDQEWFDLEVDKCIENMMAFRFEKQKHFTKAELESFDELFLELLNPDVMVVILKHQLRQEEDVCRTMVKASKQDYIEEVKSFENDQYDLYHQMRNRVKNPKALQMLNNLKMSSDVVKDRFQDLLLKIQQGISEKTTREEDRELQAHINVEPNLVTYQRLTKEAFSYQDDEIDASVVREDMYRALGRQNKATSQFLDQIKQIKNLLSDGQIRADLDLRITRLEMIQ